MFIASRLIEVFIMILSDIRERLGNSLIAIFQSAKL